MLESLGLAAQSLAFTDSKWERLHICSWALIGEGRRWGKGRIVILWVHWRIEYRTWANSKNRDHGACCSHDGYCWTVHYTLIDECPWESSIPSLGVGSELYSLCPLTWLVFIAPSLNQLGNTTGLFGARVIECGLKPKLGMIEWFLEISFSGKKFDSLGIPIQCLSYLCLFEKQEEWSFSV